MTVISLEVIRLIKLGIKYNESPTQIFENFEEPNNMVLKIFIHKKYVQLKKLGA